MKSLKKAFEILEIFLDVEQSELRLTDLAKESGLKIATVNRIAAALVDSGYLSQPEKRGKYSLGPKLLYFANVLKSKNPTREIIRPYLLNLNSLVNESIAVFNFDGHKIYCVEDVASKHPLRIHLDPFGIIPLYCSASGKIFLSNMKEQELDKYFNSSDLQAYTQNTITDLNAMKRHLVMVAQEGIAYIDEEFYVGVRSMAAGIRDTQGKYSSAVEILGPSVRLTRSRMIEILPELKRCASDIAKELGYREKTISK